jgi:glutamine amidotransferase
VTIALIDYKAGNLTSVTKALVAVGAAVVVPASPSDLASADGVVVPGVGHFNATRALDRRWIDAIHGHIRRARPLLGICLGMQWLFESSEEAPELRGLGLLPGACFRLGSTVPLFTGMKVPHVGWNSIRMERTAWVVEGVPDGAQVYFTHSYAAPLTDDTISVTDHGTPFAAIVQRGQVAGVQFHPEKSGDVGLRILRNFVRLSKQH